MLSTAVLISGNGSNLQALIDQCHLPEDCPISIDLVLSNKPDAYGLQRAKSAAIPSVVINHKEHPTREDFDRTMHHALKEAGIEIVCMAGFMRLLTPWFVEQWKGKLLNIHPSLLPLFKGLHAQKQAIEAGVKLSGCTVHHVTAEMDAGPIIAQAVVPVLEDDTEDSLTQRIHQAEHHIYPQALHYYAKPGAEKQKPLPLLWCDGIHAGTLVL